MTKLDEYDRVLREMRVAMWNERTGPRVGDFCRRLDGKLTRFTYDHGEAIQTTSPRFGFGSFYLGDGFMDYSGALDPSICKDLLIDSGELEMGSAWFFHHNVPRARNSVAISVECRVYHVRAS